ncbi:MAG: NAD(P)H-hydrate epimerase [Leptospirillum sp.]
MKAFISKIPADRVPDLTADQMREVDQMMMEELGIDLLQMMELAGSALARLACCMLGGNVRGRHVVVLAGGGNNGGGGLVAARHLSNWGAIVSLVTVGASDRVKPAPQHQTRTARAMGIGIERLEEIKMEGLASRTAASELILDAVIGYGLSRSPTGLSALAIPFLNLSGKPVLSLDVPSGFDSSMGVAREPCVRAVATLALALPKHGFMSREAREVSGRLYVADIGVPIFLYERMGVNVGTLFQGDPMIEIDFDSGSLGQGR